MEIKKGSSVATIIQQNNADEKEKKSEKAIGSAISNPKDAFEVVKNNGGLFSQTQTKENSGKKELSPEEEQRVSDFATEALERPNFFVKTSETRSKESKESGLEAPFSRPKSPEEELKEKAAEDKKKARDFSMENTLGNNPGNENVNQLVGGSNLRDTLKNEMAERHEEVNAITGGDGSAKEKLTKVMGSITPEPEKSAPTYGKDMISQSSLGINPTDAEVREAIRKREERENAKNNPPAPKPKDSVIPTWDEVKKFLGIDPKKEETIVDVALEYASDKGHLPAPPTKKDEYENLGTGIGTVLNGKNRTPESETKKGGTLKYIDYENYKGGTPEEVTRHMEYLRDQYRKARKDPGGHEIQEDPNAVKGGKQVDDPNLHVFELGNTGLVGQPDTTREQGSIGGSTQPGGASGGDVDWGPDSNQTGFTGTAHQDDPNDIQFGPGGQPEQLADTNEEEGKKADRRKTQKNSVRSIVSN